MHSYHTKRQKHLTSVFVPFLNFLYFLRVFFPLPLCKNDFLQVIGRWWSEDVSTSWQCSRGVAARTPRTLSSPPMSLQRPASSAWADRKGGVVSLTSNLCFNAYRRILAPNLCLYAYRVYACPWPLCLYLFHVSFLPFVDLLSGYVGLLNVLGKEDLGTNDTVISDPDPSLLKKNWVNLL